MSSEIFKRLNLRGFQVGKQIRFADILISDTSTSRESYQSCCDKLRKPRKPDPTRGTGASEDDAPSSACKNSRGVEIELSWARKTQ